MTALSPDSPSLSSVTSTTALDVPINNSAIRARRVWEAQQLEDRRKMKARLPTFLVFLYELVFEPLFICGEPFDIYMRKVAIVIHFLMTSACPFAGAWMIIAASVDSHGWNSKRIGLLTLCAQVSIHHVCFNYLYLRRTKSCPAWFADLSLFSAEFGMLIMTVFTPHIDNRSLTLCGLLVAALMSTKLLPLHAIIHGCIYMLHHFRSLYTDIIPEFIFPWDSDTFSLGERMLYTFAATFPSAMACVGLYVIVSGYIRRSKEAQVTNVMTITIADQLQRYDTKAVGTTITEHKGDVNEKLLDAFGAIRGSLESYRPHVPRYLIDAAVERAEEVFAGEERERLMQISSVLSDADDDDDEDSCQGTTQEVSEGSIGGSSQSQSLSLSAHTPSRQMSICEVDECLTAAVLTGQRPIQRLHGEHHIHAPAPRRRGAMRLFLSRFHHPRAEHCNRRDQCSCRCNQRIGAPHCRWRAGDQLERDKAHRKP